MEMYVIVCGPLDVNCYIVETDGVCAVIDPAEARPVHALLLEHGLKADFILLTHGHFDHVGGVAELKEKTGAKVLIHEGDADLLRQGSDILARRMGIHVPPAEPDKLIVGGDVLESVGISVINTPGHSPGSVCYVHEKSKVIFSGDTLFRLNVGRADLAGGSPYTLHSSIKEKLFTLDGDYDVYPGHGRKTALEFERERNPYMSKTPDKW